MTAISVLMAVVAAIPSFLRWWRVAQREHYLAGSTVRFAERWWFVTAPNPVIVAAALIGVVLSWWWTPAGWIAALTIGAGPIGLGIKGRTSGLAWTTRMRKTASLSVLIFLMPVLGLAALGSGLTALAVASIPIWVDLALALLAPLEKRAGDRWVDQAAAALDRSGARVVAITGSYGKTSTKVTAAHLLSGITPTVASPASFNNRMGLARAINEGLAPGTSVFIAEMGTYGPGEIADLCSWIPPEVAVMTAIGPVHLERMETEERIAAAKREILDRAEVGVINIDHPLLEAIAREESSRIRIITCSTARRDADVFVDPESGAIVAEGSGVGAADVESVHPGNVACAVGIVMALGFDPDMVTSQLADIPVAPNRQTISQSQAGFFIIDDTFNSNPAGARTALDRLARTGDGRKVLVTPGMVELGPVQMVENRAMAHYAAGIVSDLVAVGRTNRRALIDGAASGGATSVIVKGTREEAVAWVRAELGPDDTVLYENDLPDHYP